MEFETSNLCGCILKWGSPKLWPNAHRNPLQIPGVYMQLSRCVHSQLEKQSKISCETKTQLAKSIGQVITKVIGNSQQLAKFCSCSVPTVVVPTPWNARFGKNGLLTLLARPSSKPGKQNGVRSPVRAAHEVRINKSNNSKDSSLGLKKRCLERSSVMFLYPSKQRLGMSGNIICWCMIISWPWVTTMRCSYLKVEQKTYF